MKLPNPERAILGDKLERYCLNFQHSLGKHKALIFQKRLGITLMNKKILEEALLIAIQEYEAIFYKQDSFGIHYDVKFFLETEWVFWTSGKKCSPCYIMGANKRKACALPTSGTNGRGL